MTISVSAVRTISTIRAVQIKSSGVYGSATAISRALGVSLEAFDRVLVGEDIFTDAEFEQLARRVGLSVDDLTDVTVPLTTPESKGEILWALRAEIVRIMPAKSVAGLSRHTTSPVLGYLVDVHRGKAEVDSQFAIAVANALDADYGYSTLSSEMLRL